MDTEEYKQSDYPAALKRAFLSTDEALRASPQYASDPSGCTAVAALLVKTPKTSEEKAKEDSKPDKPEKVARRLYVANSGDSRSVLSVQGEAKPMSYDHKPTNAEENARIVAAGGFVEFGRVNGNLALSRAIGDFEFKQNADLPPERQIVTADPDIVVHDVTGEEEFLVLACDGIWDCLSNQQVVDYVRRGLAEGKEPKQLCEELMDKCLAPPSEAGGIGCDNMTIEIISLLGGRTKEEYYAWIKERVDNQVGWNTPETIPEVFRSRGGTGVGPDGTHTGEDEDEEDDNRAVHLNLGGQSGGSPVSVFSALAGGLQGAESEDDEGPGLRLPSALAQALAGAGIVLRPGTATSPEGEHIYEAHIAPDEEKQEEQEGSQEGSQSAPQEATLTEVDSSDEEPSQPASKSPSSSKDGPRSDKDAHTPDA